MVRGLHTIGTEYQSSTKSLKMQTLKRWNLVGLLFHTYLCGYISAVEFEPCSHPVKNKPCNMTCHVPDFSQIISINFNGMTRGSCNFFGCDSNMIEDSGRNAVHLRIPSLSYTNDSGQWTCTYQANISSPSDVAVFSGFSGVPSLKSQKNSNGVRLTATADCLYPSNLTVIVQYREQDGGYLDLNEQQVDLQNSHLPGVCSFDIENRTTANSEVSEKLTELKGKCVFFRMRFSQFSDSSMPIYTIDSGAFPFEMLTPIPLTIGLLPVLATMLIMFIFLMVLMVVNPKFSILRKIKKKLGDYGKEKLGILIAFVLAALVIGILLSLKMQCDEKDLALGLSILCAFLLAVALILTLIFYHVKVESKKGS